MTKIVSCDGGQADGSGWRAWLCAQLSRTKSPEGPDGRKGDLQFASSELTHEVLLDGFEQPVEQRVRLMGLYGGPSLATFMAEHKQARRTQRR